MDTVFITVNTWINAGGWIAALGCFLWGMISVLLSPCHMASIPLVIGYVGGQDEPVEGKQGVLFAVLFSLGLFITIAIVGIVCALLGRMLGDVGAYWTLLIGVILVWVAIDMLGIAKCGLPSGVLSRITVKGAAGAFVLGLAYGILSGSCTFGFIAPILAIITVQDKIITGLVLIVLFGIGHCIPIAIAGSSTATLKKIISSSTVGASSVWFRKGAGVLIGGLGLYFLSQPFV
jgi:cytochrome c-type biogenesis protein